MLCTLLRPTSGQAHVAGVDVDENPHEVRQHIGLVFQETSRDDRLTGRENPAFHAPLYNVPRERAGITLLMTTQYIAEAEDCDRVAISDHGSIAALDTPEALKEGIGGDLVTASTEDNERAAEVLGREFGFLKEMRVAPPAAWLFSKRD